MQSHHFDQIARFLTRESGLCFAGRRKAALAFHLEGRVARLGLAGLAGYWDQLEGSPAEQEALLDLITVNETSFFRNRLQFEDLRTRIVPKLEEERGRLQMRQWGEGAPDSCRRLRILSAGCSTGEEPYSIAMTLLDAMRYPLAWDLEIVAGDLSQECLRFAARGCYEEARLKGISQPYRDKFLSRDQEGWTVRDEVKGMVRFVKLNLARLGAGDPFPGLAEDFPGFDAIFCRNVMIYFPARSQQRLVDLLQKLLAPGGYLFTGDAEPLHLYRHDLETVSDAASLIYRKKTGQSAPKAPVPPAAGESGLSGCDVEELLHLVSDASLGLRDEAMQRLFALGLESIAPLLEAAVRNDRNAQLRNGAMELLVGFGAPALPWLVAWLTDANEQVRNFSTVMLGGIGNRLAVPHLILALDDPDPNVRHGAAEALGRIGDPLALEPLLGLLDQGFWLQCPAISALGALGSPAAVPRLLELLDDELLFEPVAQALERIGDRTALPGLRAVSRAPDARRARIAAQAASGIEKKSRAKRQAFAANR
jgi:chemotaxis protein methyltransferase CheR